MPRLRALASYLAARAWIARHYAATPLDDLLGAIDRRPSRARSRDDVLGAIRLAEPIARRARLGPDTCLFRALARYASFKRAGLPVRFVMAVDEDDDRVGHAWVELDGVPQLEDDLRRYRRTLQHPSRA